MSNQQTLNAAKNDGSRHDSEDDDMCLRGITPPGPDKQQKLPENEIPIQSTITNKVINPNIPEVSNQINYSANDENKGQAEMEHNDEQEINEDEELKQNEYVT